MSSRWKRYTIGFKSREKPKSPLVESRKQDDVRSLQGRHSVSCDRLEYKPKNMGDQMVFGEAGAASNHAVFEDLEYCKESFSRLYDLQKQKILCDVTLEVGTRSIQCHRVVLACCSQYFHAMFCTDMAERHMEIIPIKDIDQTAMEQLIEFAYTARILLTVDNVQEIFYAASILQLDSVCNACCSFMMSHLHPNNCLGMRVFAERHNHQALIQAADRYTMDYFPEVVQSEEFCTMTETNLVRLIQADELNVSSEMEVYEAAMKWVKSDVDNRKDSLSMLISKVRLPLLPATYLMHQVETEELLRRDLTCRDLLDEAKYYQLSLTGIVPCARVTDRTKFRKSYAGVIFCMGGRGNSMDPLQSVECYDLRRNIWLPVTEMMTKRRHVGGACAGEELFLEKLYAVGGHDGREHLSSAEMFDTRTNKWTRLSPMATKRRGLGVACLGGPVYAVGGLDNSQCYSAVERYDPASDTWSFVASMNIPRGGVAVASLKNYLYAVGGNDNLSSVSMGERYDPHLNKWTLIASMKTRRAGAGITALNGYLYVLGGFDESIPDSSMERYDPEANSWMQMASMSCARGGVGVVTLGGRIYAVGGHDGDEYLNTVECYDPIIDRWENVTNISICRAGAGVVWSEVSVRTLIASGAISSPDNSHIELKDTTQGEIHNIV